MFRNLKVLGLLAVAALAMSAMVASAAQAQNGILTTGLTPETHAPSTVHAIPEGPPAENYYEANGVKISCQSANVTGTITQTGEGQTQTSGEDKTVKGTGTVGTECGTLNGEGQLTNNLVTINQNGCYANFNQPVKVGEGEYSGSAESVCPGAGPVISIYANAAHTILLCKIEVEPNQSGENIIYHNRDNGAEPDDITVEGTAEGIKYENLSATCPGGKVTKEDGRGVGKGTLTSTEGHDIWISDE